MSDSGLTVFDPPGDEVLGLARHVGVQNPEVRPWRRVLAVDQRYPITVCCGQVVNLVGAELAGSSYGPIYVGQCPRCAVLHWFSQRRAGQAMLADQAA